MGDLAIDTGIGLSKPLYRRNMGPPADRPVMSSLRLTRTGWTLATALGDRPAGLVFQQVGRLERIACKAENACQFSAAVSAITALNRRWHWVLTRRPEVIDTTGTTTALTISASSRSGVQRLSWRSFSMCCSCSPFSSGAGRRLGLVARDFTIEISLRSSDQNAPPQ